MIRRQVARRAAVQHGERKQHGGRTAANSTATAMRGKVGSEFEN